MKRVTLFIVVLLLSAGLSGQDTVKSSLWTNGTACNLPRGRWELGLMTVSGYGIRNNLEISTHPLMFFLMPQVKLKIGWGTHSGFTIATEHGIFYPTLFLRLVATRGTGGLISPEFPIPQMFAVSNRILVSYGPFRNSLITAHGGISFSVKSGPLDPWSTIDLPVIYPRLAVFYNQPEFDAGIDFRGQFTRCFGWVFNVENFILCGTKKNYFMENKGVLTYTAIKKTLRLEAGYKLCFGRYPAGPAWNLLPAADVVFGFGR